VLSTSPVEPDVPPEPPEPPKPPKPEKYEGEPVGVLAASRSRPSRLTVNVATGAGFGTATANGSDSCTSGRTCSFDYPAGTTVSLVATPGGPAVTFGGWGGACSGAALTCTLTAPEASSFTVNAAFSFVP
jgi:hypothetical protein